MKPIKTLIEKSGLFLAVLAGTVMRSQTSIDLEVKALLTKMSLEEKAGQMTQIDIRNLLVDGYGNTNQRLDKAKLKEAIQTYKVGSLLNCIHAYSPAKWQELITEIQKESQLTISKIPILYGTDAVHGVGFMEGATIFPHNIGLAATRNDSLVMNASAITAKEARAVGLTWNFAPVLDVGRTPYWSRFEETFGEDVYLTTQLGTASVQGMERKGLDSQEAVASCMKHFLGYSAPKNGIDRTPAYLPEGVIREYYLPPFRKAVVSGASTIMINSGEVNGIPTHANKWLLTDVLRGELKFEGLACSDWEDIIRLHTWQKVAATPKDAVEMAINAGVDMSMVPNDYSFPGYVVELVKEGRISMQRIDEAVGRILKLKYRLGLFRNPYPMVKDLTSVGGAAHANISLEAARESITLLENKNKVLPLKGTEKILVAGPTAHSISALNSSWTYTWQGRDEKFYPSGFKTVLDELKAQLGQERVISNAQKDFNAEANYSAEYIRQQAVKVDLILLCLGEYAYAEQPGVINELALPESQRNLIRVAKSTGKPVVVCLIEGRPRLFPDEAPLVDAVIQSYRPGNWGAQAIVETLLGKNNPSGKLPYTYPKYNGKLTTYDYKFKESEQQLMPGLSENTALEIQWPFGHGLSYTEFIYKNLQVSQNEFTKTQKLQVSVEVSNIGKREGKTTVELYSRDHFASITPSQRRLRKYKKLNLKPGESQKVVFEITADDLAFINQKMQTVTELGAFDLMIDQLKVEINYK